MLDNQKLTNENNNEIRIDVLLTLCETIDYYDDYINDINTLVKKYGPNVCHNLYRIINGEFVLFSDKYKSFISKYQDVISIIKKYDTAWYFTDILDFSSKKIDTFYDYLTNNRENLEFVKYNINKLYNLGFKHITLSEDYNFDSQVCVFNFNKTEPIVLLDNMEMVSACDNDGIFYAGRDSEYKITIKPADDCESIDKVSIELNTLLFDPDRLPNDLSYREVEKKIKNLDPEYSIIQNFIKLSSTTNLLASQIENLKNIVDNVIDSANNKKNMIKLLNTISNSVKLLKEENRRYEEEVIENSYFITKEKMEKEKNKILNISNKNN